MLVGLPRYGLEFIRFALYQVWYGRRMESYLRGYRVTSEFDRHVRGLSKGTMKCGSTVLMPNP